MHAVLPFPRCARYICNGCISKKVGLITDDDSGNRPFGFHSFSSRPFPILSFYIPGFYQPHRAVSYNVLCTSIPQRVATAGSVIPRSLGRDFSASLLVFPFLPRLHLVRLPFDPFFSARFRFCDVDGRSDTCPEGSVYTYCPSRVSVGMLLRRIYFIFAVTGCAQCDSNLVHL